ELFNGRTPAIGFLKPFGCHVMILNILDNLRKFEEKGDDGYFIRYSMSSKAFRIFNKRTRKVEENLHVEFLENKAIEKGASPNWLFDIDSLTKSMNYMPVDAGTNSTNLSGTKDAANQGVKKNVSSLRYIALRNWVHDALLESSLSKPQVDCSTDVPESSRNSNPTATSINPPADQLETLTVETPIPTVSSPALTACFTDSLKPSSNARLISKRVANLVETPSLDNILTLANRFEDILRVTTNSDEPNGVEADVSNMETTIIASPTPTLRIHKDHPKSQIISPVDTPVQTRNKSKENVWTLVDCPKGVRPIGTKWVLKNKKDERGIVIRNKARLVAQGHTHEEGIDYDEVFAPVARIEAIRLFLAYASFTGFTVYQMDVKSAFLYGTIDKEVYVMQPPGFQDPEFPARVYKVEKAMYGLHQAPRAWYGTLSKYLLTNGFQRGTIDQTLFIIRQRGDFILVQVYVDDIIFRSSNPQLCREFKAFMYEKFQMNAMGELNFFLGLQVLQKEDGIFLSQDKYVESPFDLVAYSDSDYGGATQDRKSTTRGCQFLGRRLISWQCKKQTIVATSTTEAEYVTAANCCGQVLWIQNQLLDYGLSMPCEALSREITSSILRLSDSEQRTHEFIHVYFASASVCVWIGIETMEEGTKILATVDGILITTTESSLRRNLKLQDEEGISSLPDTELFENLTLMGYNISPNQKFTFHKANEPASPLRDVSQGEACPNDSDFRADQDRATIAKTSTMPYDSAPRVTSPAAAEGSMQQNLNELTAFCTSLQRQHSELISKFEAQELEINRLKARVKLLEDREGVATERSGDDAPIKGRNLDEGEAAAKRVSDDTEEMAIVLTSIDVATVLASGVAEVPTGSRSIPTTSPPADEVPTGSVVVPTASLIFATATVVTPYRRRKGKEIMVESETLKKKKLQEQIDAHVARELEEQMAREDQRMSEQEYEQFAGDLLIGERAKLINNLIKYQENYAQILKFQTQQRKPWSKKQKRDYYMAVIKSNLGSKEEAERLKKKGLSLEQESVKKLKTSEEVTKEAKSPDEVLEEKVKEMMQLVPIEEVYVEALQVKHLIIDWKVHTEGQRSYWKIIRLGGSSASYQFFVDLLKHMDSEDLNQFWALVKESLNNRQPTSDKEMEIWVELKRLYEPDDEDQLWTHTQNLMHAPVEWKL
nr:putative ribonuclease H-like domain-containing protein [Tanacetum cinerariifolium]